MATQQRYRFGVQFIGTLTEPDAALVHLQLAGPLACGLDGHAHQPAAGRAQLGLSVQVERAATATPPTG